jgi:hypothetical protein
MRNQKVSKQISFFKAPKQPSLIKGILGELMAVLNIFAILAIFSFCILVAAKGVSPLHTDVDQRASEYQQLN